MTFRKKKRLKKKVAEVRRKERAPNKIKEGQKKGVREKRFFFIYLTAKLTKNRGAHKKMKCKKGR